MTDATEDRKEEHTEYTSTMSPLSAQPALQLAAQMMHGQLVSINKHTIRTNLF